MPHEYNISYPLVSKKIIAVGKRIQQCVQCSLKTEQQSGHLKGPLEKNGTSSQVYGILPTGANHNANRKLPLHIKAKVDYHSVI